jgi:NAD(P)-dependent dehydrogenase (short-subunit alcohol dehydrogenase family)
MGSLENKVAIVTGAAWGIGRGIAQLFAKEGAVVIIADIDDLTGGEVVAAICADGGQAQYLHTNVLQKDHVERLIDGSAQKHGRLDILVNNAFVHESANFPSFLTVTLESWERHFNFILTAAFVACQRAIPHIIRSGGGSIIAISSIQGLLASGHHTCYATCKAGLNMLMQQIAVEFGQNGVRANSICPGFIATERLQAALDAGPALADWADDHFQRSLYPMRNYGKPIDVAQAALYLASDAGRFITGQALVVDGGLTIQLQDAFAFRLRQELRR